ncbi:hypothetical protein ACQP3J_31805, partial [Escherichia coli]
EALSYTPEQKYHEKYISTYDPSHLKPFSGQALFTATLQRNLGTKLKKSIRQQHFYVTMIPFGKGIKYDNVYVLCE